MVAVAKGKKTFKNSLQESRVKNIVRNSLFDEITKKFINNEPITGFTLPGTSFTMESSLTEAYKKKLKLYGVESNKAIYEQTLVLQKPMLLQCIMNIVQILSFGKRLMPSLILCG
ncbi:MAG: hypothetical protein H6613_12910 [Ignavibacteriales bacterium]|nr:hypothetical protein [Ignavibacteriales bacterium]